MKKSFIGIIAVIWVTVASVSAMITVKQIINAAIVSDNAARRGSLFSAVSTAQPERTDEIQNISEASNAASNVADASTNNSAKSDKAADYSADQPKQASTVEQKVDVKKTIETYENMLAMWFQSDNDASGPSPKAQQGDAKTVATLAQLNKAKDSLSTKDKLEIAGLLAKLNVSDIKAIVDMAKDGVTLQEAKDMDKILKKHLSPDEVNKLESFVYNYIKKAGGGK